MNTLVTFLVIFGLLSQFTSVHCHLTRGLPTSTVTDTVPTEDIESGVQGAATSLPTSTTNDDSANCDFFSEISKLTDRNEIVCKFRDGMKAAGLVKDDDAILNTLAMGGDVAGGLGGAGSDVKGMLCAAQIYKGMSSFMRFGGGNSAGSTSALPSTAALGSVTNEVPDVNGVTGTTSGVTNTATGSTGSVTNAAPTKTATAPVKGSSMPIG